jgi:Sigma-70, region 4
MRSWKGDSPETDWRGKRPFGEAEVMSKLPGCRLVHALNSLSDGERKVLYYVYVEGYQYNEAAEALGIPAGTVASRVYSGRRRFGRRWRRYPLGASTRPTHRNHAIKRSSSAFDRRSSGIVVLAVRLPRPREGGGR